MSPRCQPAGRPAAGALLLTALCVTTALAACGKATPRRPTIVLITLDTTRADHLSLYGYERRTDAALVALAARSRVYDAAVAPATWTLPSHATMFSGLDPAEHGSWLRGLPDEPGGFDFPPMPERLPLVTGPLAAAGYHLIGVSGGPFTGKRYGFARDFDVWYGLEDDAQSSSATINAHLAQALADRPADAPLFLFVNYFDAHGPYDPPKGRAYPFPEGVGDLPTTAALSQNGPPPTPEQVRLAIDQYDRELYVQDESLGILLGWLEQAGLMDDALVIVTADHGEAFGEQDLVGHSGLPIEPLAHVPLVVHRSGGPVDRVATPVSLANIPTTILTAAGLPPLPAGGSPRLDLLALPAATPPAYSEMRTPERWVGMLRQDRIKYYRNLTPDDAPPSSERLVDLAVDPGEATGRAWSPGDWLAAPREVLIEGLELQRRLAAVRAAWLPAPDAAPVPLTDAERQRLQELGYF